MKIFPFLVLPAAGLYTPRMVPLRSTLPLRAVLFDRDDTLARSAPEMYLEAADWLAARHGLDAAAAHRALVEQWQSQAEAWRGLRTLRDEQAYWTRYAEALAQRLGLEVRHVPALLQAFPYERFMRPVAGAREVLAELRARGLRIGVLSNTLPSIDRTLRALDLADLVDVAVATCTVGVHKPEPGAFRHALAQLDLPAAAVLLVDDLPENVAAARAVGLQAALIDLTGRTEGALHDLRDVLALVAA